MSFKSKALKRHKLYYKEKESQRSLSKTSFDLFIFVINHFINKGGSEKYQKINKDVKSWKDYKPITVIIPQNLTKEFEKATSKQNFIVSYDGTWKPLAMLIKTE